MSAPDQQTADLMRDLSRMQTWATLLMARQTPGAREAVDLCQRTRAFIAERLYRVEARVDTPKPPEQLP